MVVIASHDNIDYLKSMLKRLSEIDLDGHDVLIVDTNSTNKEYLEYFNQVKCEYPDVKFDRKNYTCWENGAILHGYRMYKRDRYIFLNDSVYITNDKFFIHINNLLNEVEVVPIWNFVYRYDTNEQQSWVEEGLPIERTYSPYYPEWGIISSMFAVRYDTLTRIPSYWLRDDVNQKYKSQGMERRWSLMFHLINASKKYLDFLYGEKHNNFWQFENNTNGKDTQEYLIKYFNLDNRARL